MRVLSLERLVGPNDSTAENFELLILSLLKERSRTAPDEWHRIKSPDHGIDLFNPRSRLAIQCKAYSRFRADLVRSVARSAQQAVRAQKEYNWTSYGLAIPFVPTGDQRLKLNKALSQAGEEHFIYDGDHIEAILYTQPEIVNRFFPTVTLVLAIPGGPIRLDTGSGKPLRKLFLKSFKTGQSFEFLVSSDATCGGLVNLVLSALRLPESVAVNPHGLPSLVAHLKWNLTTGGNPEDSLDPQKTLLDSGIVDGTILFLRWDLEIIRRGMFMRDKPPPPVEDIGVYTSRWHEDEMIATEFRGTVESAMSDYVAGSLKRLGV